MLVLTAKQRGGPLSQSTNTIAAWSVTGTEPTCLKQAEMSASEGQAVVAAESPLCVLIDPNAPSPKVRLLRRGDGACVYSRRPGRYND
jgi:hypothetical protein